MLQKFNAVRGKAEDHIKNFVTSLALCTSHLLFKKPVDQYRRSFKKRVHKVAKASIVIQKKSLVHNTG